MKARHTGTRVTILLLLLIPWESDRQKQRLVCQMGRVSNRGLELPLCKQNIKAQFFPLHFIIPTKYLPFISACLPPRPGLSDSHCLLQHPSPS